LTASFREGEFELPEKGTGQLASAPLPEKGGNQFPEKGGNKSGKLPEKDAKKRASMLQSTTSGKKLTDQDVAKVCLCTCTLYFKNAVIYGEEETAMRTVSLLAHIERVRGYAHALLCVPTSTHRARPSVSFSSRISP